MLMRIGCLKGIHDDFTVTAVNRYYEAAVSEGVKSIPWFSAWFLVLGR
jgi:hypothetical protein